MVAAMHSPPSTLKIFDRLYNWNACALCHLPTSHFPRASLFFLFPNLHTHARAHTRTTHTHTHTPSNLAGRPPVQLEDLHRRPHPRQLQAPEGACHHGVWPALEPGVPAAERAGAWGALVGWMGKWASHCVALVW